MLGCGVPTIFAIAESVRPSADASTIWIAGSNFENASTMAATAAMSNCKSRGANRIRLQSMAPMPRQNEF
jgi:hypothetical protein